MVVRESPHMTHSDGNVKQGRVETTKREEMNWWVKIDGSYWKKRAAMTEIHFHLDGRAGHFSDSVLMWIAPLKRAWMSLLREQPNFQGQGKNFPKTLGCTSKGGGCCNLIMFRASARDVKLEFLFLLGALNVCVGLKFGNVTLREVVLWDLILHQQFAGAFRVSLSYNVITTIMQRSMSCVIHQQPVAEV